MENEDNKTLEKVARVLISVDKGNISDKKAIDKIMKIVLKNSNRKLKEFLNRRTE